VKFTILCVSAGNEATQVGPTSARFISSYNERTWATSRLGVTEISAPCTCQRDHEVHGMRTNKLFIYR